MNKLAIFYMIGQYGSIEQWKSMFNEQMKLVLESKLYDNVEFIDVFVKGKEPIALEDFPSKVNNITYLGDLEEDRPTNRKLYRAYNQIMQRMWTFSNANPEYKVLFFHSIGISHVSEDVKRRSTQFREYMGTFAINCWKECIRLLDHYDCVGTEYIPNAVFGPNQEYQLEAPHYQGFFWWATSNYIKRLDPCYFYQDVPWQPYLCELWIGSGNPKAYNFYNTWKNRYYDDLETIPYEECIQNVRKHLVEIENDNAQV